MLHVVNDMSCCFSVFPYVFQGYRRKVANYLFQPEQGDEGRTKIQVGMIVACTIRTKDFLKCNLFFDLFKQIFPLVNILNSI